MPKCRQTLQNPVHLPSATATSPQCVHTLLALATCWPPAKGQEQPVINEKQVEIAACTYQKQAVAPMLAKRLTPMMVYGHACDNPNSRSCPGQCRA